METRKLSYTIEFDDASGLYTWATIYTDSGTCAVDVITYAPLTGTATSFAEARYLGMSPYLRSAVTHRYGEDAAAFALMNLWQDLVKTPDIFDLDDPMIMQRCIWSAMHYMRDSEMQWNKRVGPIDLPDGEALPFADAFDMSYIDSTLYVQGYIAYLDRFASEAQARDKRCTVTGTTLRTVAYGLASGESKTAISQALSVTPPMIDRYLSTLHNAFIRYYPDLALRYEAGV